MWGDHEAITGVAMGLTWFKGPAYWAHGLMDRFSASLVFFISAGLVQLRLKASQRVDFPTLLPPITATWSGKTTWPSRMARKFLIRRYRILMRRVTSAASKPQTAQKPPTNRAPARLHYVMSEVPMRYLEPGT
jgi:hypothetical protein